MKSATSLFWFAILLLGLSACKEKSTTVQLPPLVKPPVAEFDPSFAGFEFDNAKGHIYEHPSGTQITIPPNTFIAADSQVILGKVTCRYREFQDAADVYLAGIPMSYASGNFQTAGSFELQADQLGRPLQVAQNQQLTVNMASFTEGGDYDFFYLDESKRGWDKIGSRAPVINEEVTKTRRKINRLQPDIAFPLNRQYIGFNYRALMDIFIGDRIPTAEQDANAKDQFKAYGIGWTDIDNYDRIDWKGTKVPAALMVWKMIKRQNFPDWTEGYRAELNQLKGNRYRLNIVSKDSSQFFETELAAIMPLKDLFAFPPEEWARNYKATMLKIQQEQERLEAMAAVFREFEISKMGIYNWDRLLKMEESVQLQADFKFPVQFNEKLSDPEVVYISGDNRAVIKFPQSIWPAINLLPSDKGRFFCLLPEKRLAIFTQQQFEQIDFESIKKMEAPAFGFVMEDGGVVANADDFRQKLLLP